MSRVDIVADGIDAATVAAILRDRQRAIAHAAGTSDRPTETLLGFELGGVAHALPIGDVRAVAALPPVAPVPHGPAALLGLVAWRGAVVNLFAPGRALGRDTVPPPGAMIVLRHDHPRIALAVDLLLGVSTVERVDDAGTLTRLAGPDDARLTRVDTASLIETLLPARLQEG